MHRVTVGMHVDIKRSNGRVHGAVVTDVDTNTRNVRVEWFEGGETKGKELDFATLLQYNKTLETDIVVRQLGAPTSQAIDETINFASSVPRLGESRIVAPVDRRSVYKALKSPIEETPALPPVKVPSQSRILKPIARPDALPFENESEQTQIITTEPSPLNSASSATNVLFSSSRMKSNCVNEVERLAARREERRQQQHAAKRLQEEQKTIDPGNPNWVHLSKIREYRATIDFRPLRLSDPVVDNRISVCVRKRPLSKAECTRREVEVVTIPNKDHLVVHQLQSKVDLTKYLENQIFRFDYTFDENSNNEMIYRFTAQPLVRVVFEKGFATCFAYGQTGSGKTHTMGGNYTGKKQDHTKGIYYMTANDVFKLQQSPAYAALRLNVVCSFFEIYGAKVFDLLNKRSCLRVLEDGNKSVCVVGLSEVDVSTPEDVMQLIKKGNDYRTAGSTSANANSSRSHAIFQITLKNKKNEVHGKFSLIDLAGNERGADTTSSDRQTRLEGAEINKSLLALKECIRAMSMNKSHIPFRMSKLTLVLRDSFVNENARTCMIAMISPGNSSVENTLNTLRYADRVKELGSDDCPKQMSDSEFRYDDEEDENMDYMVALNTSQEDRELIRAAAKVSAAKEGTTDALLAIYDRYKDVQKLIKQIEQDGVIDVDLERLALNSISLGNELTEFGADLRSKGQNLLDATKSELALNRRK